MSQWARENPHLVGTGADPWIGNAGYRKAMADVERECPECGDYTRLVEDGVCRRCAFGDGD